MKLKQWVLIDLDVFRREWLQHRFALKYKRMDNGDGTFFIAYDLESFPHEMIIASDNLPPDILDPEYYQLDLLKAHPGPTRAEISENLARAEALRIWHTDRSITVPFETFFQTWKRQRGAA